MREKILATIINKSTLKQRIFDNTFSTFNELKDVLDELYDEAKIKLPNGDVATMKLTAGTLEISREMKRKRTA